MAFCEGCGATLAEDARFCEACGRPAPQEDSAKAAANQVAKTVARVVKEMSSAAPNELGESVIASWKGSSF